MSTYEFIKNAIQAKISLSADYQSHRRHFSPHAIGRGDDDIQKVMAYQYGGGSTGGLPSGGDWRCYEVSKLSNIVHNDSPWRTSNNHSKRNRCVTKVDLEVNY